MCYQTRNENLSKHLLSSHPRSILSAGAAKTLFSCGSSREISTSWDSTRTRRRSSTAQSFIAWTLPGNLAPKTSNEIEYYSNTVGRRTNRSTTQLTEEVATSTRPTQYVVDEEVVGQPSYCVSVAQPEYFTTNIWEKSVCFCGPGVPLPRERAPRRIEVGDARSFESISLCSIHGILFLSYFDNVFVVESRHHKTQQRNGPKCLFLFALLLGGERRGHVLTR